VRKTIFQKQTDPIRKGKMRGCLEADENVDEHRMKTERFQRKEYETQREGHCYDDGVF